MLAESKAKIHSLADRRGMSQPGPAIPTPVMPALEEERAEPDGLVFRESGLTTAQFTRHLSHVEEEATKSALQRYVGEVSANEIVTMVRNLSRLKARYVAVTLAAGTNSNPPTPDDTKEMRAMRERIEELEQGVRAIKEAIAHEMVPVAEVVPDSRR
ncbi:MAG: hypothetical protein ACPGOY_16555 [Rhodospirillaceae bacterium]